MQDLITLAQAKSYLQIPSGNSADDPTIQSFVDGASEAFLTITSLPYIALTAFTERRNGTGGSSMTTRNRPLQSISSLIINNIAVPVSPDGVQVGYYFEPESNVIYLTGGYDWNNRYFAAIGFQGYPGKFIKGYGNVFITGTAGYPNTSGTVITAIPAPVSPAVVSFYANPEFTQLVVAAGATVINLITNLPMTQIPSGTPASGEFVLDPDAVFVFAGADALIPVQINYTAIGIPADIQQCVTEMVAWAYKERDRVGVTTERFADNLSQSYARTPFSERAKLTIQRYTRKDAIFG
jgi:hypothetical protein